MKVNPFFGLVLSLALLPVSSAFADHGEYNGVARLKSEAQQLHSVVQYSYLRQQVKSAVSRFSYAVDQLDYYCDPQSIGGDQPTNFPGTIEFRDGHCQSQIRRILDSWYPVEQFLQDSYYDHGDVHQQYQMTKQALFDYLNGNGGGGGGGGGGWDPQLSVSGSMNYRQFTFYGFNRGEIIQQCLSFGREQNLIFINDLVVNGQRIYVNRSRIERVCETVSQYARAQ